MLLRGAVLAPLLAIALSAPASGAPCDAPANAIVAENCLPGDPPEVWNVVAAGDPDIQGFTTDLSVNRGGTVVFKIDTDATDYRLDIYRMGFYGGLGARHVATVQPGVALPQNQPACLNVAATGLVDCGNWAPSAVWAVPGSATSGIYFAKLVREDGIPGESHVVFIVRDDTGGSPLLFQTSDTTWQAYNQYGGNSLYVGSPAGRAFKVSYNRPFTTRGPTPEDWVFNAEYPMVRWLESNGYDVSYTTGVDTARRGAELLEHQIFLTVGHDEYWSNEQRASVEAARDAGVHLAAFTGNEVFWKTRWEQSIDGSGTPFRTLVTYKETHANAKIDPLPGVWTGTWRDPRFSPPADGNRPENALTGTIFTVNCCSYAITVPAADGKMRFWRNTSVATLAPAQTATLGPETLGYEWDEDLDNGARPGGLVRLSSTTVNVPQRLLDYGSNYGPGTATHHLVLRRHASGALVFGAGTVQWSWGSTTCTTAAATRPTSACSRRRSTCSPTWACSRRPGSRGWSPPPPPPTRRRRRSPSPPPHPAPSWRAGRPWPSPARRRTAAADRWAASRSPSTAASPGIRPLAAARGATPGSCRSRPIRSRSSRARRTTAATSGPPVRPSA